MTRPGTLALMFKAGALANWHGSVLIAEAHVQAKLLADAPGVVAIAVESGLVAVVDVVAAGPLTETSWGDVMQILGEVVPLVIAANALREGLRSRCTCGRQNRA